MADPAKGIITYSLEELIQHWSSQQTSKGNFGVVLLLEPTPALYQEEDEWSTKVSFVLFFGYLFRYKKLLLQLALGFAVGSLLQLILPFLTQSVVDVGINTNNLDFIYIVLIAQFMLLVGRMSVDFIRSWILLHISTRLNVSVLSLFLSKLMRLPISFFDTKQVGGIMQRMGDQKRIESFLTGQSLRWRSLCLIW
ncbi:ABC transporter transmembrane domain-containing protein [Rufibacter quisquiliarum]|uniref:ABC transporter transmembrane domain-containing protein n=1 Tax=Rufibacter quisquiliarum TaxID=1549639 RepID=UPI0035E78E29